MQELTNIQSRLKDFENDLYGFNYECSLEFVKIDSGVNVESGLQKFKVRYPYENRVELVVVDYKKFEQVYSNHLLFRGDKNAGLQLSQDQEAEFMNGLRKFQSLVRQKLNPSKTKVFNCINLNCGIFWNFGFILVSQERNSVYSFVGMASD